MTRLAAALLLAGSLLPLANWIPSGERDADYLPRLGDWALGSALCAMVGVLVWFLVRRRGADVVAPSVPREIANEQLALLWLCAGAAALYGAVALLVFSGRPLLIDEVIYVLQAQDLAAGRLTHEIPGPKPFFSVMHEVDLGDRAYGQYPFGGPAMLVPGVLLGATWVVGPVFGAVAAWAFGTLLRVLEPTATARWRLATTALFVVAPFGAFMFGSHMNHATTLAWLLLAAVALSRAVRDGANPWWGLATGLGLGIAATIRPLDAAAYALPAAAWLAWRARRGGRPLALLLLSGVGVAAPMALAFWANAETTGHPLRFGYDVLWGANQSLGFHDTPWGDAHTPQRGLELLGLYLTRLNTYLFELPFPSLLLPAIGLWLLPQLRAMDRYLAAAAALVGAGYWAYWHDGFYPGPRFLFAWLPVLVLWSARGCSELSRRCAARPAVWTGVRASLWTALALAVVSVAVIRWPTYRNGMASMRVSPRAASEAGVDSALVLVQESWGSQLMVRLWDRGITRPETEYLYRSVDSCVLEESLSALEQSGTRGDEARALLLPLAADSARLIKSTLTPDPSERQLPGLPYTEACVRRIAEARRGYLLYAPWRIVRDGNVYARWLPGREAEIAAHFPGRPVYLLRRGGISVEAPLVWERLDVLGPAVTATDPLTP
ncbi:MAG: hypothetical protein KF689_13520 [Gemmatimonadaceae bacterium]|nr:hypothetical protein [Gemmatimonadaceae bacterium]MCW5826995.1 hypothetical protein [Gemmatimonadaceae bacterium]